MRLFPYSHLSRRRTYVPEEDPPQNEPEGDASEEAAEGAATERVILPQYLPLYERNPDFFGWLSIEGIDIDYPVMYTPDDSEHYLRRAFDGSYSGSGVPFVDGNCPADGSYYLIYGHHMNNGTMFGQLPEYQDEEFCKEHPVICFDTLYEKREYVVMAAFFSRIYGKDEQGVFRYYEYFDLSDPAVSRNMSARSAPPSSTIPGSPPNTATSSWPSPPVTIIHPTAGLS